MNCRVRTELDRKMFQASVAFSTCLKLHTISFKSVLLKKSKPLLYLTNKAKKYVFCYNFFVYHLFEFFLRIERRDNFMQT